MKIRIEQLKTDIETTKKAIIYFDQEISGGNHTLYVNQKMGERILQLEEKLKEYDKELRLLELQEDFRNVRNF